MDSCLPNWLHGIYMQCTIQFFLAGRPLYGHIMWTAPGIDEIERRGPTVHIRMQMRTAHKSITIIDRNICRRVLQLNGGRREDARLFLVKHGLADIMQKMAIACRSCTVRGQRGHYFLIDARRRDPDHERANGDDYLVLSGYVGSRVLGGCGACCIDKVVDAFTYCVVGQRVGQLDSHHKIYPLGSKRINRHAHHMHHSNTSKSRATLAIASLSCGEPHTLAIE